MIMADQKKKQIPLRLSAKLYDAVAAWAEDDFRSVNGQIEYLLTECVRQRKKNYDDKELPLCYNQLKALYFCKRHHITVFTGAHHFEEGRPLRIILQRTWKFSML